MNRGQSLNSNKSSIDIYMWLLRYLLYIRDEYIECDERNKTFISCTYIPCTYIQVYLNKHSHRRKQHTVYENENENENENEAETTASADLIVSQALWWHLLFVNLWVTFKACESNKCPFQKRI